ncbi:MAG: hypothetical protein LBD99_03285 [Candidatus Margulisbacteria bacterium]|jgi:hypothetical protein|nr:hypothetical protein [Candidatus Margulisiibacteriota bacterium]
MSEIGIPNNIRQQLIKQIREDDANSASYSLSINGKVVDGHSVEDIVDKILGHFSAEGMQDEVTVTVTMKVKMKASLRASEQSESACYKIGIKEEAENMLSVTEENSNIKVYKNDSNWECPHYVIVSSDESRLPYILGKEGSNELTPEELDKLDKVGRKRSEYTPDPERISIDITPISEIPEGISFRGIFDLTGTLSRAGKKFTLTQKSTGNIIDVESDWKDKDNTKYRITINGATVIRDNSLEEIKKQYPELANLIDKAYDNAPEDDLIQRTMVEIEIE